MSEHFLDASGLICPLPVLRARKTLEKLPAGDILRVRVTDKSAPKDFALYCAETGHALLRIEETAAGDDIFVRRR